jgi:hypothetical protein
MAWTVFFIVVFGIAIVIPIVWAVVGLAQGNRRFWPTLVGAAWAVALMLVTFIGSCTKWGECSTTSASADAVHCARGDRVTPDCKPDIWARECGGTAPGCATIPAGSICPRGERPVFVFCERAQEGGVKQPWATWSDLSFIASGLWILWLLHYLGRPRRTSGGVLVPAGADNPMMGVGWLSVVYGLIVIFMGPASMWYHASLKSWAGWFDSMSVVFWLSFNAFYVLYMVLYVMRGCGRGAGRTIAVLCLWAGFSIVFAIVAAAVPGASLVGYFISGGLWGLAELLFLFALICRTGLVYQRTWWLILLNILLLGLTMTIWVLFNDGVVSATTCQARESFPGHALFHILASFSTVLTFITFASERRVAAGNG